MRKNIIITTIACTICLLGISQKNYSGTYIKTADTKLDGTVSPPGGFRATIVFTGSGNFYRGTNSTEGRYLELTILPMSNGSNLFSIRDSSNSVKSGIYVAYYLGRVVGNSFIGVFYDVNGAKGDIILTKQEN